MAKTPSRRGKHLRLLLRVGINLVVICLLLLAARLSLAGPYRVDGPSDAPSLLIGDRVWINFAAYDLRLPFAKWSLMVRGDPGRGDMVSCYLPGKDGVLIKRVIAVGGDTVELRDNQLFLNGEPAGYEMLDASRFLAISETHGTGDRFAIERIGSLDHMISFNEVDSLMADYGPTTVPSGHYFVLGDNRDNSYDSRDDKCGCIPRSAITGRLMGSGRSFP